MRSHKLLVAAFVALLLIGPACSNDDSTPTSGGSSGNLNQFVDDLPAWQQPAEHLTQGTAAIQTVTRIDEPIPDYQCTITRHDWAKSGNEVFAPEQDFATLWPGAMFHGRDYRYGALSTLELPRSPITVYSNLPGSKSVTVDSPNSVSMNDAVNQIRGSVAAGNYQSEWEFRVDEVYSNLQGTMEAGLNAGYSEVASGGLTFSESRTVTRHVFFGRAVQRMYTIRFADDQLKTPAEFFDGGVTAQQLRDAGIDDSDVPVYVRSITYGQMIVFKAELSNLESGTGFKADFKAAWEGFTAGGSGGSTGTNLLKQATYEAIGYGGDPGNSANAHSAVAEQKFGTFFDGATVQNAVPLFSEVVTLKDGEPASLGERVIYETWENCKAATGYTLRVKFARIKADAKVDENHTYEVDSYCGVAPIIPHISKTSFMDFPQGNHWYSVNETKECTISVGSLQKFWVQYWGPLALTAPELKDQYPFPSLERNYEYQWMPSVKFKDGILPGSPERTVTGDIRVTLIPTYD